MTIGVKYCGGCNPSYERVQAANMIKRHLNQHTFKSFSPDEDFDKVLVINGCEKSCAQIDETKYNIVELRSDKDIDQAIRLLNE